MPGLRKERTTVGEALAISILRTEAGVDHLRSEILVKSPSEMRAAGKLEVGSRAGAPSERR
jgi:hypothetical protein